jgi:hypothetical protein
MTKRAKPRYSRKDVLDALQNLIAKGLVVTKQDPNGQTRYIALLEPIRSASATSSARYSLRIELSCRPSAIDRRSCRRALPSAQGGAVTCWSRGHHRRSS